MTIEAKHIKTDFANIRQTIRFVYQSDKGLFSLRLVIIVLQSILPLASLYVLKLLVDLITNSITHPATAAFSSIGLYAGIFCGIYLMTRTFMIINQLSDEVLSQKLIDFISNLLHKKSTELDLAYYDNATYHDTFHRAQQEAGFRPIQILDNMTGIFSNGLSLIGVVALLFTFSWLGIVIMIVAGLPSLWVKLVRSKVLYDWRKANTSLFRKTNYFSLLLTSRIYAKEIRIFRLATHFQELFNAIRKRLVEQIQTISTQKARLDLFSVIMETGALFAVIFLLCNKAFSGAITIGSFVMFFEAFRRGQGYVQGMVTNLSKLYENKLFLTNLFEFMDLQPTIQSPIKPVPFPKQLIQGIRFENVSFTYPGSEKKVIRNFNLSAKPGEITVIEGENGAGKTTLMKLLCRLYECSEGAITIESTNIKNFDVEELRKNISVIFQDFAQFDLTAKENITLGDIENSNNKIRLKSVAYLSCAEPVIEQLPLQQDTLLGKYFEQGEELSMGQWQRVALARTLYKDAPILILDEPTSWLDAGAKSQFNQNLSLLKKNKILLLISHTRQNEFENIKTDSFKKSNHKNQLLFT